RMMTRCGSRWRRSRISGSGRWGTSADFMSWSSVPGQSVKWWSDGCVPSGPAEIIVISRTTGRRSALASAGGATQVLDEDVCEIGLEACGIPTVDVVIDTTGNPLVLPAALRLVSSYGCVVLLGDTGFPSRQRITP